MSIVSVYYSRLSRIFFYSICFLVLSISTTKLFSIEKSLPKSSYENISRIVAVGDVHADYSALVSALKLAGVIDSKLHWVGGKTHLVQTGDILDRGKDSRKVLDLLINLEKESLSSGGRVHVLIGNHELMNMCGDIRYIDNADLSTYSSFSKTLDLAGIKHGTRGHKSAFDISGYYGKWLREHLAVVKINDTIFLHGGLSPKVSARDLDSLNSISLQDMWSGYGNCSNNDPDSILWFRGYALDPESLWSDGLQKVLENFSAKRMVMGHTTTHDGFIQSRFGGKAIFIDTGISAHYGSHVSVLEIKGNTISAIYSNHKQVLADFKTNTPAVQ